MPALAPLRIQVWQGFHGAEIRERITRAWRGEADLLILCPPGLTDFSFLARLPLGEVEGVGGLAGKIHRDRASHGPAFPEAPVLGVFTSGTAGRSPRLVLYSRRNLLASLHAIRGLFDTSRLSTIFSYPQPFHVFGLALGYLHALEFGLELVTGEGKYGASFHELRARAKAPGILTLGAPAHFHDLLAWQSGGGQRLAPSYSCIVGGARVPAQLWRRMRDELAIAEPSIGYGCSEASPGITHLPPGHEPREDGEIGFVLPGVTARISYARSEDRADGLPGDALEFSGENLCLAMIQDGRLEFPRSLRVSDRVAVRARDQVWVHAGRADLVLNRGGRKLSLELIEQALQAHAGRALVCVPTPDARLGEELGILVEGSNLGPEWPALVESFRELLAKKFELRLAESQLRAKPALPLNASFKLDRAQAARLFTSPDPRDPIHPTDPPDPTDPNDPADATRKDEDSPEVTGNSDRTRSPR